MPSPTHSLMLNERKTITNIYSPLFSQRMLANPSQDTEKHHVIAHQKEISPKG